MKTGIIIVAVLVGLGFGFRTFPNGFAMRIPAIKSGQFSCQFRPDLDQNHINKK